MVALYYFLGSYLPGLAHSQTDYLPLIQIASITGVGGLVFLIYWFAGTVNRLWESGFEGVLVKRLGGSFLAVFSLVLVFGEARLAASESHDETVQVGMINLQRNRLERPEDFDPGIVRALFELSGRAVSAGAEVVVWAEANVNIPADFEADLIERGKAFARENGVFLSMSFRASSTPTLNENKTVGVSPEGEVVVDYLKSNLIPVMEAATRRGDGEVAAAMIGDRLTGHVICYDLDFPAFIRQAGKRGVDILFAPSSDWREIRFLHAASARFRAIENGFSLVRPTIQGLTIATDPYGRVLAYHDYYSNASRLTLVGVPSRGVTTVYATCGEWFSLTCIVLLGGMVGRAYSFQRDRVGNGFGSQSAGYKSRSDDSQ